MKSHKMQTQILAIKIIEHYKIDMSLEEITKDVKNRLPKGTNQ